VLRGFRIGKWAGIAERDGFEQTSGARQRPLQSPSQDAASAGPIGCAGDRECPVAVALRRVHPRDQGRRSALGESRA
jgi:hypothetical protein